MAQKFDLQIDIKYQKIKMSKICGVGIKTTWLGWYWQSFKSNHAAGGSKTEAEVC